MGVAKDYNLKYPLGKEAIFKPHTQNQKQLTHETEKEIPSVWLAVTSIGDHLKRRVIVFYWETWKALIKSQAEKRE